MPGNREDWIRLAELGKQARTILESEAFVLAVDGLLSGYGQAMLTAHPLDTASFTLARARAQGLEELKNALAAAVEQGEEAAARLTGAAAPDMRRIL